jgi:flagellar biosynthesis protein FlhG
VSSSLDSLREFMRDNRPPHQVSQPGVWVVGSGKGGVGTSTVCAMLAAAGHAKGLKTLLVDGDEVSGALHLLLGSDPGVEGIGLLKDPGISPDDLLVPLGRGLDLLPGGGGVDDGLVSISGGERRYVYGRLRDLFVRYSLVVVDGGSRLDSVGAACQTGAERLIAVTTPDRVASGVCYALLKATYARFPGLQMGLVVNHASRIIGRQVAGVVSQAAERFLEIEVGYHGAVPTDGRVSQMIAEGGPWIGTVADGSLPAFSAANAIVKALTPEPVTDDHALLPLSAHI